MMHKTGKFVLVDLGKTVEAIDILPSLKEGDSYYRG